MNTVTKKKPKAPKTPKFKHWSEEEDAVLRQKGPLLSDVVLSYMLPGRSPATIRQRRYRLGLNKDLTVEQKMEVDERLKGAFPTPDLADALAKELEVHVMSIWTYMWSRSGVR